MALMLEVAKLMEHFQWLAEAQTVRLSAEVKNAVKCPAEKVRGSAKKHSPENRS